MPFCVMALSLLFPIQNKTIDLRSIYQNSLFYAKWVSFSNKLEIYHLNMKMCCDSPGQLLSKNKTKNGFSYKKSKMFQFSNKVWLFASNRRNQIDVEYKKPTRFSRKVITSNYFQLSYWNVWFLHMVGWFISAQKTGRQQWFSYHIRDRVGLVFFAHFHFGQTDNIELIHIVMASQKFRNDVKA